LVGVTQNEYLKMGRWWISDAGCFYCYGLHLWKLKHNHWEQRVRTPALPRVGASLPL
jgi:hypothetical protein